MEMNNGAAAALFCPNCGNAVKPNARFCGKCGSPVQANRKEASDSEEKRADSPFQLFSQSDADSQTSEIFETSSSEENTFSPFSPFEMENDQTSAENIFSPFESESQNLGELEPFSPFGTEQQDLFSGQSSSDQKKLILNMSESPFSADPFASQKSEASAASPAKDSSPFSSVEPEAKQESVQKDMAFDQQSQAAFMNQPFESVHQEDPIQAAAASFCPSCGQPVKESSKFCSHCGQSLTKKSTYVPYKVKPAHISNGQNIAQEKVAVFQNLIQEVKEDEISTFAHDLPKWNVEPPVIPVRRRRH